VNLVASVQQALRTADDGLQFVWGVGCRAAQCSDLSGGVEYALIRQSKETWRSSASCSNRPATRPAPRRHGLGAVGGRKGAGAISAGAGGGLRDRAQRVREEARPGSDHARRLETRNRHWSTRASRWSSAQHDRVVASYGVLTRSGRLSPIVLNLQTTTYDPSVHYQQVRDSWVGVRIRTAADLGTIRSFAG